MVKTSLVKLEYQKQYAKAHKDKIKKYYKEWREKNKEYLANEKKIWAKKNKDRATKSKYAWMKRHPGQFKAIQAKRRDRILFGGNRHFALERDNWECQKCGLNNEQHIVIYGEGLNVHHIDGNKKNNNLNNFLTLCVSCHSKVTNGDKCE